MAEPSSTEKHLHEGDVSLCRFFEHPQAHYSGVLSGWVQDRVALGALLPQGAAGFTAAEVSVTEAAFLGSVDMEALSPYMTERQDTWAGFMEYMCKALYDWRDTADKTTPVRRHHFVLATQQWPGWEGNRTVLTALTQAWGWYGGKVHGKVVMLDPSFLDLRAVHQIDLLERLMA